MHGKHRHAAVDDLHAVLGQDVGDGAAAADIDLAQFGRLEEDAALVHDATDARHVLGVGVVGARLAARAGELVEREAMAQVAGILGLKDARKTRVEGGGHVAGEHPGPSQAAAQRQVAGLARQSEDLGHGVLEETARHARGTHRADFLLIHEQGDGGAGGGGGVELGQQARIGTHAVVVAIAGNQGAVQAAVARAARRNDLELGRDKVLLLDAVLVCQDGQDVLGHGVLGLLGLLGALALGGLHHERAVAHDDVEHLALDDLGSLLGHLVLAQVGQQVGDVEHGVGRILAHADLDVGAVLQRHHAVQGQRHGDPLVLLDTAVVVRVEAGDLVGLVERVLLHVEARRVDVGTQDVEALLERLGAEMDKQQRLAIGGRVHLVAGDELLALGDAALKRQVAGGFGKLHSRGAALALGLVLGDEVGIAGAQTVKLGELGVGVALPRVGAFHE